MEKIALLFTGQGSQFVGMAKSLFDELEIVRQTFEEASDIIGKDISALCFEGSLNELSDPSNIQPALLTVGVATYRAYIKQVGIRPVFVAGHSLGEYAALISSGAVRFSDGLKIIKKRAELTQKVIHSDIGSMTIIDGLDREIVEHVCSKIADNNFKVGVNCYNAFNQFSIAGLKEAVAEAEVILEEKGATVTPLLMSAPFHSILMEDAVAELKAEAGKYEYYTFNIPVISNAIATPYKSPEDIPEMLALHLIKPVQWQSTLKYLQRFGISVAVEIGPKNILSNLIKANKSEMQTFCYGLKEDRKELGRLLFEREKMKRDNDSIITKCLTAAVSIPNLNVNSSEYKEGVIEPYRKIQKLQEEVENSALQPSAEQIKQSLQALKGIFEIKGISAKEQKEWFHRIKDETLSYYLDTGFELFC